VYKYIISSLYKHYIINILISIKAISRLELILTLILTLILIIIRLLISIAAFRIVFSDF